MAKIATRALCTELAAIDPAPAVPPLKVLCGSLHKSPWPLALQSTSGLRRQRRFDAAIAVMGDALARYLEPGQALDGSGVYTVGQTAEAIVDISLADYSSLSSYDLVSSDAPTSQL
eukprot:COSAG01_NODE_41628_length_449_cov_0.594286_1_plen_116_part_00